jgi:ribokinase
MNMDLVVETDRYPEAGETILGGDFKQIPGGKGANQALAAAKLGGKVEFIGACGRDNFADLLQNSLSSGGVKLENLFRITDINTGVAMIVVEQTGDNRIIVSPGANYKLTPELINKVEDQIAAADLILLQLEIPVPTIARIVEIAAAKRTKVILDPAPAVELPHSILAKVDYLLPNEGELNLLLPDSGNKTRAEKIAELFSLGVKNVIVTEGEKGISFYSPEEQFELPALNVQVVDTTAAGDVFAGAFASQLLAANNLEQALNFAIKAAAYSVTKSGAQSSVPTLDELNKF